MIRVLFLVVGVGACGDGDGGRPAQNYVTQVPRSEAGERAARRWWPRQAGGLRPVQGRHQGNLRVHVLLLRHA